jgi:hypothetical protein
MKEPQPDSPSVLRKITRDGRGDLAACLEGQDQPVPNVKVARCFPWSLDQGYVSVRDKDGKELALLKDLEGIDPDSRRLIEQELREKVFVPKIRRIKRYSAEFDVIYITADTDRGEVTFQIRDSEDVRALTDRRALFRDVDGNVYEVEDLFALDRTSQKYIEQYF